MRNKKLLKHSERDLTSIDLLIRGDFYYSFANGNIVKGQMDELIAIETYPGGFILSAVLRKILTQKVKLVFIPHVY